MLLVLLLVLLVLLHELLHLLAVMVLSHSSHAVHIVGRAGRGRGRGQARTTALLCTRGPRHVWRGQGRGVRGRSATLVAVVVGRRGGRMCGGCSSLLLLGMLWLTCKTWYWVHTEQMLFLKLSISMPSI